MNDYLKGAWIVGILSGLAAWVYAVGTWGWFLGIGLGWLPAAGVGIVAGLAWPLIALALGGFVLLLLAGA